MIITTLKEKKLFLEEQILSFKSCPEERVENRNGDIAYPEKIPIHFMLTELFWLE